MDRLTTASAKSVSGYLDQINRIAPARKLRDQNLSRSGSQNAVDILRCADLQQLYHSLVVRGMSWTTIQDIRREPLSVESMMQFHKLGVCKRDWVYTELRD